MSNPQYPPPQQPPMYSPAPMTPSDERMWGMFGHLSAIAASLIGLTFLGPLIIFLVYKDRNAFVRGHSAEALNMSISFYIYEIVLSIFCTIISVVTLGYGSGIFFLLFALGVVFLIFTILAAVAANSGRVYRYPLIIRLVR